jgi:Skp family chaperone for outer membrane proteins
MNRMTTAIVMSALLIGGPATARMSAQTVPPKPPPAAQTPPKLAPPPLQVPATPPAPVVPFPADAKIAFVNFQQVASDSSVGKAAKAEMNALGEKKGAEISTKNIQLKALQDRQNASGLMNDQAKKQVQTEIDKLTMEIQYMGQTMQKDLDDRNSDLMNDFYAKVVPVVEAIAKEKNLDAVLSFQDSGALYLRPGLDISAEVTKRLDAQFKK